MTVEIHELADGAVCDIRVSGKLDKSDYDEFVPALERLIHEHGKVRFLCRMHDFKGWTLGAAWEDMKYDFKHFNDIDRLAIVGETKLQKAIAVFSKPFTRATIKYFDHSQAKEAEEWILEGIEHEST